ncbi:MAG: hypothetical protein RL657_50 [Pseudomonadota bacterium]|jgi:2-amino-4-hydroxy-6-hydroxymethyldihydropteridine diphosphokinase
MRPAVPAWVAVGANLGDAAGQVRWAFEALRLHPEVNDLRVSRLYRSAPHEAEGPDFINAVVCFETPLTAPALLQVLQALEQQAGRERPYRHAPRTLDLDLLFYGAGTVFSPRLTVPHPRWHERAFVLWPLGDVSPDKVSAAQRAAVAGQAIEVLP